MSAETIFFTESGHADNLEHLNSQNILVTFNQDVQDYCELGDEYILEFTGNDFTLEWDSFIVETHPTYSGDQFTCEDIDTIVRALKDVRNSWFPESFEPFDSENPIKVLFYQNEDIVNDNENVYRHGFVEPIKGREDNVININISVLEDYDMLINTIRHELVHAIGQDSVLSFLQDPGFNTIICDPREPLKESVHFLNGVYTLWGGDLRGTGYLSNLLNEIHTDLVANSIDEDTLPFFNLLPSTQSFLLYYNLNTFTSLKWTSAIEMRNMFNLAISDYENNKIENPVNQESFPAYTLYTLLSEDATNMEKDFCRFIVGQARTHKLWHSTASPTND
jgi:hypothetical protein